MFTLGVNLGPPGTEQTPYSVFRTFEVLATRYLLLTHITRLYRPEEQPTSLAWLFVPFASYELFATNLESSLCATLSTLATVVPLLGFKLNNKVIEQSPLQRLCRNSQNSKTTVFSDWRG